MDWDREERERAIQEADRLQAEFERDEWLRAQRQKRSAPVEIVHKTYEPKPALQQPSDTMDATTQAAWDTWVQAHIRNALAEHREVMTEAIAEFASEYVHKHLKAVREEIGALRADMTVQTSIQRGEIAQIKKGKANVA